MKWYCKRTRSLLSIKQKGSVQNQHHKPLHLLSNQHEEEGTSEVGVHLGSPVDSRARTSWKVFCTKLPCDNCHPPECQFHGQNRDVNSAISARFRKGRLRNNQIKAEEGWWQKCSGSLKRCATVGLCIPRHRPWNLYRFYGRSQTSWNEFEEYDSQKLRSVTQTSKKTKDHRSVRYKSKFLTTAVPTLWNMRIDLKRRLKDKSDEPEETRGDWPRTLKARRKGQSYLLLTCQRMEFTNTTRNKTRGKRICCRFRREHAHVEQERRELCELETVKVSKSPTTVVADNGEVQTKEEEVTVYVKELDVFVTVMLLQDTPAFLSLGKLCEDHGYSCEWTSGQKPQLIEDGRRMKCSTENYVPIVVPGFIDKLFKLSHTYISNISIAGSSNSYNASRINKKGVRVAQYG